MNVLVPMAGKARSFLRSKFKCPRQSVIIKGSPILHWVFRGFGHDHDYCLVVRREFFKKFSLNKYINQLGPSTLAVLTENDSQGQACTALWAKDHVLNDDPIIITSPDQVVSWNVNEFFEFINGSDIDACMVITERLLVGKPRFGVTVNTETYTVSGVFETSKCKYVDCGFYYFKYGWYFDRFAREMISDTLNTYGKDPLLEYWIAPVLNQMIVAGKKVVSFVVEEAALFSKPQDVRDFESSLPSWAKM